jgi:potassium/chloride transporter 4/5/6
MAMREESTGELSGIFNEGALTAKSSFVQDARKPKALPSTAGSAANAVAGKKLGTLLGVFVPCTQNILGAIYFMRLSWIVGVVGVRNSLLTVGLCCATTFLTALSLSAIATNGAIKGGGPYYLISRALGPEFGGSVGLCFYLGTTFAGSMYVIAVAETLLTTWPQMAIRAIEQPVEDDPLGKNSMRIYGACVLVFSALLVLAGVRYVSRVTPFFLIFVVLSVLAILIGLFASSADKTFETTCPEGANLTAMCGAVAGITGLSSTTLGLNWRPPAVAYTMGGASCASALPSNATVPCSRGTAFDLQYVFALFFPSVTGAPLHPPSALPHAHTHFGAHSPAPPRSLHIPPTRHASRLL